VANTEPIVMVGDIDIALPPKPSRGGTGKTKYPFDSLEVGKFFSLKNKTRRAMAGPVGLANKRFRDVLKNEAGETVSTKQNREFYAADVDAELAKSLKGTPHEGAITLVIRSV
jgi:hypothetical protein